MTDEVQSSSGLAGALPALHSVLARSTSARVRKAASAVVLGYAGAQAAQKTYRYARSRMSYRVAVSGDDLIYARVHHWITDAIPERSGRSLQVQTRRVRGDDELSSSSDGPALPGGFHMFYDGAQAQHLTLDGHRVTVSIEKENQGGTTGRAFYSYMLVFTAYSIAGREAVLDLLRALHEEETKASPTVRVADSWGGWRRLVDVPPRPLDSVILPAGDREALEADLTRFLAAEQDYARWGMPWHRGYLFSGPPGTGKTSTATALAAAYGLDVYYMSLSSLRGDDALLNLLVGVEPRSVLIIEDIDIVHASKSRDDAESKGVTLTGLLNALDGFLTPHGLLTILTTNDRDVLDAALVRPGRVDFEWTSTAMTEEQAGRIADYFGYAVDGSTWAGHYAAELVAHLKTYEAMS